MITGKYPSLWLIAGTIVFVPIKAAVLQAESRKTARLAREPTGFPNKFNMLEII